MTALQSRSALRIERVDVIAVEVPRKGAFRLHRGQTPPTSPYTVIRITTDAGIVGYGEGDTQVRSLYAVARDHLAPLLIGEDARNLAGIHARMDRVEMMLTERLAHWNVVRAAIDMALHDCLGKWLGLPVAQLLGGLQRDRIETVKNLGVEPPDRTAEEAVRHVAAGYRVLKMRVGADPELDLARVRTVRNVVGTQPRIRLDANQAWTPKEAVERISAFSEFGLEAVEQPCVYWDLEGGRRVAGQVRVPIICDEGFWTLHDAQLVLSARAADVLHVYLGKCGGLFPAMKIAALAQSFGSCITAGERVPLGISEAAHLHYAAALPGHPFPAALSYDLNEHNLLATPLEREGASVLVPSGPGLGIQVDEDRLAHYTRRDA